MLSTQKFSADDLIVIKAIPKSFKVTIFIYSVFCIPICFVVGLFGLPQSRFGYLQVTSFSIGVYVIFMLWKISNDYIVYRKDLSTQEKLTGSVVVTSKSDKKGDRTIFINSTGFKKFEIYSEDIFDSISVGDELTIEVAKYSKRLLLLEKNGRNLLDGH